MTLLKSKETKTKTFGTVPLMACVLISTATLALVGCGGHESPEMPTVTVGGIVSGLTASGLKLQLNDHADWEADVKNGTFIFPTSLPRGSRFVVSIKKQPYGQRCGIFGNEGIASNNMTIRLACSEWNKWNAVVSTFVGRGAHESGTADGSGSVAQFFKPAGSMAVDADGNVFVADKENHTIRKVTPGGVVSTHAGTPAIGGLANGARLSAKFQLPSAMAIDKQGDLYVADTGNCVIRKITAAGEVSTFTGAGSSATPPQVCQRQDGDARTAGFDSITSLAFNGDDLYVGDKFTIRKVTPLGSVSTYAGDIHAITGGMRNGPVDQALFGAIINGIAFDKNGTVFVADTENNMIRTISAGNGAMWFRVFNLLL